MTKETKASNAKPDLVAKLKEQRGGTTNFLPIGAAWTKDDGSVYIKLYGNQIIDQPFYLFPVKEAE